LYSGDLGIGKDCRHFENALSPTLPHGGQIAADSSVTGRLKKNARTSTAGIFQVAFIARQMEQTPQAFFQTAFEPIGRLCAARRARGGLGLQGKWGTRACVPHTLSHAGYGLLWLIYE